MTVLVAAFIIINAANVVATFTAAVAAAATVAATVAMPR